MLPGAAAARNGGAPSRVLHILNLLHLARRHPACPRGGHQHSRVTDRVQGEGFVVTGPGTVQAGVDGRAGRVPFQAMKTVPFSYRKPYAHHLRSGTGKWKVRAGRGLLRMVLDECCAGAPPAVGPSSLWPVVPATRWVPRCRWTCRLLQGWGPAWGCRLCLSRGPMTSQDKT